jgi:hypothetical protein
LLQISVPVSPGSSGGPVLGEDGRVIGLVVSGIRSQGAENLNFALSIDHLRVALAVAGTAEPAPVAEAITVTFGERPKLADTPGASGPSSRLDVVNDSLGLDWTSLAGITAYTEDHNNSRTIRTFVQYRIAKDAQGAPVLERYQINIWNQGYQDRFQDELRTIVSKNGDLRTYYQRTSHDPAFSGGSYQLVVESGHYRVEGTGPGYVLPRGVLLMELQGAAIAALPDPPPASASIWFVGGDSANVRAVTLRVDFVSRGEIEVPVARAGWACQPNAKVDRRKLPVIWVTATIEASRQIFPVLASRPHMRVDGIKCLAVPALTTRP